MPSTITSLYDAGAQLLAACVDALDLTPAGAPARRYVSDGPVAFDCEQVTVEFTNIGQGDTAPLAPPLQPGRRALIASLGIIGMQVIATRCVPILEKNAKAPAVAKITLSAEKVAADGWALWNHLHQAIHDGTLFPGCQGVIIQPALPINTSGGIGGWILNLRVPLDGIPPA